MNFKIISLVIGLFAAGLVLYKFIVGFILPIAMLVFLGYILKTIAKDSGNDLLKKEQTL